MLILCFTLPIHFQLAFILKSQKSTAAVNNVRIIYSDKYYSMQIVVEGLTSISKVRFNCSIQSRLPKYLSKVVALSKD